MTPNEALKYAHGNPVDIEPCQMAVNRDSRFQMRLLLVTIVLLGFARARPTDMPFFRPTTDGFALPELQPGLSEHEKLHAAMQGCYYVFRKSYLDPKKVDEYLEYVDDEYLKTITDLVQTETRGEEVGFQFFGALLVAFNQPLLAPTIVTHCGLHYYPAAFSRYMTAYRALKEGAKALSVRSQIFVSMLVDGWFWEISGGKRIFDLNKEFEKLSADEQRKFVDFAHKIGLMKNGTIVL
ncbi:hypothetical protein L596_023234 [Steinernema carpocapsae]|uniref:Uncharacterized protein n=1 Tax=Steinernema carpocapsae TaxID=34508 RepID=A0A4U5MD14_STECR|nr:hypothetical protein L596_023234 [Steinernema carpocapsae]